MAYSILLRFDQLQYTANDIIHLSIDTDALYHIACTLGKESVKICLRIAVVGTPTGQVINIVVSLAAELGGIACCHPLLGV